MKLVYVLLIAVTLSGCTTSTKYEKQIFEELFSLDVESTMVKSSDNDPLAKTEYGNEFKEFYFKVIHSEIEDYRTDIHTLDMSAKEIFDLHIQHVEAQYEGQMDHLEWIDSAATIVNKLPCTIHEMSTQGVESPIRYKIAYYHSKKRIYELHVWATENRIERFNPGMDQMIYSFKEL